MMFSPVHQDGKRDVKKNLGGNTHNYLSSCILCVFTECLVHYGRNATWLLSNTSPYIWLHSFAYHTLQFVPGIIVPKVNPVIPILYLMVFRVLFLLVEDPTLTRLKEFTSLMNCHLPIYVLSSHFGGLLSTPQNNMPLWFFNSMFIPHIFMLI